MRTGYVSQAGAIRAASVAGHVISSSFPRIAVPVFPRSTLTSRSPSFRCRRALFPSFQDHLGIRSSVVYDDVEILHSERTIHLSICHLLRNDPCL
jgi:hypothetical protein